MSYLVIVTTCSDQEEADRITDMLLEERVVACVQQLGPVSSSYWWKGSREKAQEIMISMKTEERLFHRVESIIRKHHSYDVPEIIALPLSIVSTAYGSWISEIVGGTPSE